MAERLKALVLAPSFLPDMGGLEMLSFRLVQHAQRMSPFVVAPDTPGSEAFDAEHRLEIRRTPNEPPGGRRAMTRLAVAATREAYRRRPDVVAQHAPALELLRPMAGEDARRALRPVRARARARPATAARPVPAPARSGDDRRQLLHGRARARVWRSARSVCTSIPPGVDLQRAIVAPPRDGPPTIVTVARLDDEYKGHDVVLAGHGASPRSGPRRPLDRRRRRLAARQARKEAQALGLTEAVDFRGAVSDAERDHALDSADVFVMASRVPPDGAGGEGFGMVYLEASARGVPVIAGRAGGAVDAVDDGVTGYLIDPESPDEVADAVLPVLTDDDRARALGQAGHRVVEAVSRGLRSSNASRKSSDRVCPWPESPGRIRES